MVLLTGAGGTGWAEADAAVRGIGAHSMTTCDNV